jgi:hypothetical protein
MKYYSMNDAMEGRGREGQFLRSYTAAGRLGGRESAIIWLANKKSVGLHVFERIHSLKAGPV